jgi:hypothetical protein
MNLEKVFKNLILANIGIFILIIVSAYFQNNLVLEYSQKLEPGFFDTQFGLALVLSILIMYVISVYCLYNFKALVRSLFLYTIISYIICLYFGKIQIIGQITYILQYIATLTDGAILTLLYFSPIKEKFQTS